MERTGSSDIEGKAAREAAREVGAERVSIFFRLDSVISAVSVVKTTYDSFS